MDKKLTTEEVEKILANTDWNAYWKRVCEACTPELEAYRIAAAKSKGLSHSHVYL